MGIENIKSEAFNDVIDNVAVNTSEPKPRILSPTLLLPKLNGDHRIAKADDFKSLMKILEWMRGMIKWKVLCNLLTLRMISRNFQTIVPFYEETISRVLVDEKEAESVIV